MKNLFFISPLLLLFFTCYQTPQNYTADIHFETMGTFGTVKIVSDSVINEANIAKNIDSIFIDFNNSLSTYLDSSIISRHNRGEYVYFDDYLNHITTTSYRIFNETKGTFNPKVKPLFDYWKNTDTIGNSVFIDSLVQEIKSFSLFYDTITLINPISLKSESTIKFKCSRKVDFSAIAKGYGVDVIAYYLDSLGYTNYMVDIGGEVNCKGKNKDGNYWRLGIEEPNENTRSVFEVVQLHDKAMATSGNYRNFKVLDSGQKIVHIINPKTGYPEISNLLSASIIADNCMEADAYATACMVMGVDTCYDFILNQPDLEAFLIYSDENGDLKTKITPAFKEFIVK